MRKIFWALLAVAMLAPVAVFAQAPEKRVALVIGNDNYRNVKKLERAGADSKAMARELSGLGFQVLAYTDLDRRGMNRAFSDFSEKVSGGGVGVIFYAGHGVQLGGNNYLLPIDVQASQEQDITDEAINVARVLEKVADARAKFSMLILDACRDNPFPKVAGRSVGGTRGLTMPSAPNGVMIVYSAGVNEQALDRLSTHDKDPNGLFTREFLKVIKTPGLRVDEAVKRARTNVRDKARAIGHTQNPAIYDQTDGEFYFIPPSQQVASVAPQPAAPAPAPAPTSTIMSVDPAAIELEMWQSVKDSKNAADYEEYLKQYPKGRFAGLARNRIKSLTEEHQPAPQKVVAAPSPPAPPPRPVAPSYSPGQTFRDCADCPEMVVIPAGRFVMGSSTAETTRERIKEEYLRWEKPQHDVTIRRNFAMGKYSLTRGEWTQYLRESGRTIPKGCTWYNGTENQFDNNRSWSEPGFAQTDRHPVVCVSGSDAREFAQWLSMKTGKYYRLPTEAEWEYAARAGSATARYWGEEDAAQCDFANGADTLASGKYTFITWGVSCRDGFAETSPVGSFRANGFGLYDTLGNVWQWAEDCWNEDFAGAPTDGSAWKSGDCGKLAIRGASWRNNPGSLRAANRSWATNNFRGDYIGLRVVRDLE